MATLGPRPARWPLAAPADVSAAAAALVDGCEVVDLHIDSFIPARLVGYDLLRRHAPRPWWGGGRMFGHLDLPRAVAGGLTAGMWSITTNPFAPAGWRWRALQRNIKLMQEIVERSAGAARICRGIDELRGARAAGAHAVLLAIQGGNALQAAPEGAASLPPGLLTRVTLVHLTHAVYGPTSSPLGAGRQHGRLTAAGAALVEQLNHLRIFVDVAHLGHRAVADVAALHDRTQPLVATHTGVSGVRPHWRNLDDDELRAIAATDGVVGVVYHSPFLRRPGASDDVGMVVDHLDHIARIIGVRHCAVGTDYDGAITPPPDLRDGASGYLRLADALLRRGWREDDVVAVLGGNALRALAALRPSGWTPA